MDQDQMFQGKYGIQDKPAPASAGPMRKSDWCVLAGLLALAQVHPWAAVLATVVLFGLGLAAWYLDQPMR